MRTTLTLQAIAKAEKIVVTQEEKDAEIKRLAEQYSMPEEQVRAVVAEKDLESDLSNQKAAEVIYSTAKVGKPAAKKAAPKKTKTAEAEPEAELKPKKKASAAKEKAEEKPAAKKAAPKKTKKSEE